MEEVRATLLGTGHAWPIPRPGCACDQCRASRDDAGKRRTRSGLLLQTPTARVLLDACPDAWLQFEREGLEPHVDRVVISHHHDDHLMGLRDLCMLRRDASGPLPVHCGPVTKARIQVVFPGLLRAGREKIAFEPWQVGTRLDLGAVTLEGFETHHREEEPTTAFLLHVRREDASGGGRAWRIAYATDMGERLPSPRERVEDVDLFLGDGTYLGAGGYGHPGTDRMIAIARELRARCIGVTHVGHWAVDCDTARRRLAPDVVICRDGDDVLSLLE